MTSPTRSGWLDPGEWERDGRGRDWQFAASTEALRACLEDLEASCGSHLELLAPGSP